METNEQRAERIIAELRNKYPRKNVFDLQGNGLHFVCEVEPTKDHPEYDKAIEVIIKSKPHKHLKMTQVYTVLRGELKLHLGDKTIIMKTGDKQTIPPGVIHWAESDDECWEELYSTPGWIPEDHILV